MKLAGSVREVLLFVVLLSATSASADDSHLVAARISYDNLEQAKAIAILSPQILATLDDHDRASALRLLGCAHMVLGDHAAAIASFRESFELEPDAALEGQISSPDARSLFELARGEWRAGLVAEMEAHAAELAKLGLAVHAPETARGGEPLQIGVDVVDASRMVARVELLYRRRGQAEFTSITTRPNAATSTLSFTIPPTFTSTTTPFAFEYHVTLRHQSGFDLRRFGDPDHPHVIAISAGHPPRWYDLWWVRGAIAVGVVGIGVGSYLAYRSLDVGPQTVVVSR